MLHKETIASGTLECLKQLMLDSRLENFILVGGTALALQIGHRKSIDLDFFSVHSFNENELAIYLEGKNKLRVDFLTAKYLSLNKMLMAFESKYNSRNPVMPVKALAYHNDINFHEALNLIGATLDWNKMAGRIQDMIQSPDKVFPSLI
jgi:hypothetical protein